MEPNYENYTNQQLVELLNIIDKEQYPGRYEKVAELLKGRPSVPLKDSIAKNANAKKLISPLQMFLGSFWGGPIFSVYSIRQNFLALGEERLANKTVMLGILVVITLVALVPFTPDFIPNLLFPAIYGLVGKYLVERFHLKKDDIENSAEFDFESSWIVFGKGTIAILIFFILIFSGLLAYEFTGILNVL